MLVKCSKCRTQLKLPPKAKSIRCAVCRAVTKIAYPQSALTPWRRSQVANAPSPHGRKKAVIVGISYKHSKHELKGCINDAKCMRFMLINRFKFPAESIIMLTEEETDKYRIPTKQNIRMAMHWLVKDCKPGDSLVFHFSGHGSRQRDRNGDEVDGYDETLCPVDFKTQGMIIDDEINHTIVRPIIPGARLHAIIDACHSGTVLDLPYLCRMNRSGQYAWEDHRPRSGKINGSSGGEVISFSGCDDDQTSADTSAFSKIASTGAMTFCFIQAIERGQGSTYGSILTSMRTALRNAGLKRDSGHGDNLTALMNMLLSGRNAGGGFKQIPQLTACSKFDVFKKPFYL